MDICLEAPHARKLKRSQVTRACDACREHRTKCDHGIPCSSCRSRNTKCTNASIQRINLPQALREIERLKAKINQLEVEQSLKQQPGRGTDQGKAQSHPCSRPGQGRLSISSKSPIARARESQQGGNRRRVAEGIYIRTTRSAGKTWYGPSSLFYFIGKMSSFLESAHPHVPTPDQRLDANSTTMLLDQSPKVAADAPESAAGRLAVQPHTHGAAACDSSSDGCRLRPMEEEYFLDLYWTSYHTCLFPIIDEAEFKEYYRSLYAASGNVRNQSALVDILLALSMQQGISGLPTTRQPSTPETTDATVAGRWYYLRCQRLLSYELESPTVSTLQCQLLSAVYLCCATFQNMADNACCSAVRTAYMLGIHQNPAPDMPPKEREIRKRLWWGLFMFDSKFGMKLGRPFQTHPWDSISPALPKHGLQAAALSGSSFAALGDNLTWLSFNTEMCELFLTARTAYAAIFDESMTLRSSYQRALDATASLAKLQQWAKNVPSPLLLRRKDAAFDPLSTVVSDLELEGFEPLWLKRQRLILELMYHNLSTNLHRPFIIFDLAQASAAVEKHAKQCANHAMALTRIIHQVLSSTTMLAGWHEVFQWQWNAAMTLAGFILAYPQNHHAGVADEAFACLEIAIDVLDIFGASFTVATSAAAILRQFCNAISLSSMDNPKLQKAVPSNSRAGTRSTLPTPPTAITATSMIAAEAPGLENRLLLDDLNTEQLRQAFGLAFDVDQWTTLDSLWPAGAGDLFAT